MASVAYFFILISIFNFITSFFLENMPSLPLPYWLSENTQHQTQYQRYISLHWFVIVKAANISIRQQFFNAVTQNTTQSNLVILLQVCYTESLLD